MMYQLISCFFGLLLFLPHGIFEMNTSSTFYAFGSCLFCKQAELKNFNSLIGWNV